MNMADLRRMIAEFRVQMYNERVPVPLRPTLCDCITDGIEVCPLCERQIRLSREVAAHYAGQHWHVWCLVNILYDAVYSMTAAETRAVGKLQ
jgi:hypothetical protein